MQKKNIAISAGVVLLLLIGFASGYVASTVDPVKMIGAMRDRIMPHKNAPAEKPVQGVTPELPTETSSVFTGKTIPIDKVWPEWPRAQQRWQQTYKQSVKQTIGQSAIEEMIAEADRLKAAGDLSGAGIKIQQVLLLNPELSSLWVRAGDIDLTRGWREDAVTAYLIAEALEPDIQEKTAIYQGLVNLYEQYGDTFQEQHILALERLQAVAPDAATQDRLDDLRGKSLRVMAQKTNTDGETPEACFTFSWALQEDGSVNYEDFIATKPGVKIAAIPSAKQLCLRGFAYGKNYDVTLKSGLPAKGAARLAADEQRSVSFDDRTPKLAFQGNTYIIPRLNNLGVPLRGVNVDVAHVEILQVNDRNLVNQIIENNVLQDSTYYYALHNLRDNNGRRLWEGNIDLQHTANKTGVTAIPFGELVKKPVPGLYAVVAQPAKREDETSATNLKYIADDGKEPVIQWLVVTDVGMTAYRGQDGLHLAIRSYDSALPLPGVKIRLLSRDNAVLSDAISDKNGHVAFPEALLLGEGGQAPKLVQAFGPQDDFTFMDLQQPALDLSDNSIDGRSAPKKMDAFIYSERGIYRPGDTMHLSTLLRNVDGNALEKAPPLTVKIMRPDGVLFSKILIKPHDESLGGYHTEIALPENARMGVWHAEIFSDPTEPALGSYNWQVEDFVPARMEVKMTLPENAKLSKEQVLSVPVQADYLYGAAAAKSRGDASLDLRAVTENPFKDFPDYQFGLLDATMTPEHIELSLPETDEKGASRLEITLKDIPPSSKPLEALVHASVFDDTGRAVNRTAIIPVTRNEAFLGLKEDVGADAAASEWHFSADRQFQLVAVNRDGKPVEQKGLRYRLVREEYRYDWYNANNSRNYQAQIYDVPVTNGAVDAIPGKAAALSFKNLDYGTYRLEVVDPTQITDRLTAAAIRFNVGWTERTLTAKDKPDGLQLRLDRKNYRPGDTAQLFIKAPFEGEAELVLAREGLLEQRVVHLPKEGATIALTVGDNWGPGVYALVHAYRPGQKIIPGSTVPNAAPGRAAGVIWAGMDPAPRVMDIAMQLPEIMMPRQKLTIPVQVTNADQAEITIAAVDEGILQLTDFESPGPEKYFYAKRRLEMEMRDSYGRLLDPNVDAIGKIRSGGDQSGRSAANLPSKWIKPLALFSGPVALDKDGKAEITFDLPEFNGKIRLMAVAYGRNRLGHAEQSMIIRGKVVVNLGLPRFLAPEDKAELALNLDNVDGADGVAKLQFTTTGGIELGDYPEEIPLKVKQKQQIPFTLHAEKAGPASLKMTLVLPDGTTHEQHWDLTVRPSRNYQTTIRQGILKPGKELTLDDDLLENILPDDAIISVALGAVPDLQLARAIRELDRYPYGCLEQTSSRLLPLLYLPQVLQQAGIQDQNKLPAQETIDRAIAHILSMQRGDGSFSLWNGYGSTEEYLSLYAIDVLQRAHALGYVVPDYALNNALNWLHEQVKSGGFATPILHRRAYAYYLLAKAGLIEPGQIRYFAERYRFDLTGRQAQAFLAAALTQIGDEKLALPYWKKALSPIVASDETENHMDYGSGLRDSLIALTLATEAGQATHDFAATVNGELARHEWLSTQENGWIILASHALYATSKPQNILLNGDPVIADASGPILRSWSGPDWAPLEDEQVFENQGEQSVHYTVAINAIPEKSQPPESKGMTIQRKFFTRSGQPVDPEKVKQNDMLITVIEGEVTDKRLAEQALLVDLMPAGLELESARFGKGQDVGDFAWIGALTTGTYQELRDDRFLVAFDPTKLEEITPEENEDGETSGPALEANHFRFAYAVRAVTKGDFVLPAAFVEGMYQPQFHALGRAETIRIK